MSSTKSLSRPPGHHAVTPSASIPRAGEVLTFLERAFEARVLERYDGPNHSVAHAEVMLGDSVVMLGEPKPGEPAMPATLSYYVADAAAVDDTYRRAIASGASSISPPTNEFYGYRTACVRDVGGNRWTICTVIEQLTRQEIDRRMQALPHK
jgi:PhnB protein